MKKAQGSLEYLIIVAAVLAVAAIVVLFLTGSFGVTKAGASVSECKAAASQCSVDIATTTGAICDYCEEKCTDVGMSTDTSKYADSVEACKDGAPNYIASGEAIEEECDNQIIDSTIDGVRVDSYVRPVPYEGVSGSQVSDCSSVQDSTIIRSMISDSIIRRSIVQDADIDPSVIEDTVIYDSTVEDSTIEDSMIFSSDLTGSTIEDSSVKASVVTNEDLSSVDINNYVPPTTPVDFGGRYVEGEFLVMLREGLTLDIIKGFNLENGVSILEEFQIENFHVMRLGVPAGKTELEMMNLYRTNSNVLYAERNWIFTGKLEPDDTYYIDQWNLEKIEMPKAWDIETKSDHTVIVAILDTGIQEYEITYDGLVIIYTCDHPDIQPGNIVGGYDFVNDDNEPWDDSTPVFHGTRMFGIMAAITDNTKGIAGTSWSTIIKPVKVLDQYISGSATDIAQGITHATNNGADIISMSFAGNLPEDEANIIKTAVEKAYAKGILMISVSGNENTLVTDEDGDAPAYPCSFEEVFCVGATNPDDERWVVEDDPDGGSNYGDVLDLVAPGEDIYATIVCDEEGPECWGQDSGTSTAAPQVAAVAAIIKSIKGDLNHKGIASILKKTADDLGNPGKDDYYGWGRLNGYKAIATAKILATPMEECESMIAFIDRMAEEYPDVDFPINDYKRTQGTGGTRGTRGFNEIAIDVGSDLHFDIDYDITRSEATGTYMQDEVLAILKPGHVPEELDDFHSMNDVQPINYFKVGDSFVTTLKIPETSTVEEMVDVYNYNPIVEHAEPNYVFTGAQGVITAVTPNDPLFSDQWALEEGCLDAEKAWGFETGSDEIIIGVIDSGVSPNADEITPKIDGGWNIIDNNRDTYDKDDHGTKVASIAAAVTNNNKGIAGVAWEPKIKPVVVLDSNLKGSADNIAKGITFATDECSHVMTLAFDMPRGDIDSFPYSFAVQLAIDYATEEGYLVTSASGNDNEEKVTYPCGYRNVMCAAGTNENDKRWSDDDGVGSNSNLDVDISAPAVNLKGLCKDPDSTNSIICEDPIRGTSLATAHAAGLAALIYSKDFTKSEEFTFNSEEVEWIIYNSAKDLGTEGWDPIFGYGRIDMYEALLLTDIVQYIEDKADELTWDEMLDELKEEYPEKSEERLKEILAQWEMLKDLKPAINPSNRDKVVDIALGTKCPFEEDPDQWDCYALYDPVCALNEEGEFVTHVNNCYAITACDLIVCKGDCPCEAGDTVRGVRGTRSSGEIEEIKQDLENLEVNR